MSSKLTFNKWSVAMFLFLSLGLAACGSEDGGSGDTAAIDSDGDGLSDIKEEALGTSVVLMDTDGDGFSDGKEVIEFGFNPDNNNYRFNPLIADVPDIQVKFVSLPDIDMTMTSSTGSDVSRAVERTNSSASSFSRSRTNALSVSAEVSASLLDFGASSSVTKEESVTWSAEQSRENSQAYSNAANNSVGEELTGGGIAVALDVRNEGHLAFTVSNLVLSANLVNPLSNKVLEPLGNLVFDSVSSWNDFPVAPGGRAGPFTYSNDGLTVAETRSLLADSTGLAVSVAVYDITDEEGRSFTHDLTAIGAKTAVVTIDYGPDNARGIRSYLVATNSDPDQLSVTAETVFTNILRIPYEQDVNGLTQVNGVAVDSLNSEKWMVVHRYISGEDPVVDVHDPAISYDFNNIVIRAGHTLHLVRAADTDDDGLGLREELLFGTRPDNADTDGDTLSDGDEVKLGWINGFNQSQVYSSATLVDTDGDGVNDNAEKAQGSHPGLADTDGDGQNDNVDSEPTVALFPPSTWATVAAGDTHVLAIKQNGTLWSWGFNIQGQLGLNDTDTRRLPTQVGSRSDWATVFPCLSYSFAIDNDGSLWAWGKNSFGVLGLGDAVNRLAPVQIGSDTNWRKVACGAEHVMGMRHDGSLWAWGKNVYGQLGLGDTVTRHAPTRVGTAFDWHDMAASFQGTLLLKQPGDHSYDNMYVMGNNFAGALAASGGPWTTPTAVNARGVSVVSNYNTSFHINSPGFLYSSGRNFNGVLGTGGTANRDGWGWITGNNYDQVIYGGHHVLAIIKAAGSDTGTLYGWGQDGSLVNSTTPVSIGSSSNWKQVAAGVGFSLILDGNGHLWSWGINSSGQLGVDSTEPYISDMTLVH